MNELTVVDKATEWRRMKSLVLRPPCPRSEGNEGAPAGHEAVPIAPHAPVLAEEIHDADPSGVLPRRAATAASGVNAPEKRPSLGATIAEGRRAQPGGTAR